MSADAFIEIEGPETAEWVIICDHARNTVPTSVAGGDLGLPPEDMARHIAYDPGAEAVTRILAEKLNAPAILATFSRLVIDPNRGEDDPTLLMRLYDGTIIPANRHVDAAERERRLDLFHRPYHGAVWRVLNQHPNAKLIAIHSFTRRLRGREPRPWHVGLLYAEVVADQIACGIDIPTDGEVRRENYVHYQCRHFDGFDFQNLTRRVLRNGAYTSDLPTIREPIKPQGEHVLVRDWQIAQAASDGRPVKITLPGPMTISDTTADEYYNDPAKLAVDLAAALTQMCGLWQTPGAATFRSMSLSLRANPQRHSITVLRLWSSWCKCGR